MKFGKSLSEQIDDALPEWKDKFLSYKRLKKILNLIHPINPSTTTNNQIGQSKSMLLLTSRRQQMQMHFIRLLERELHKLNCFFLEKEEDFIIRLKEMQARVANAKDCTNEIIKISKQIVDFHGEIVLLGNYSALNYLGLMKILKKFDRRTGTFILLPFIKKILKQPFVTTKLINEILNACETMLDQLKPLQQLLPVELQEIPITENLYMRSSVSALRVLREISRRGSSTVNAFSLPPLQNNGQEEEV
ncbi:unnamed protein product [Rhodiola kirilowii]